MRNYTQIDPKLENIFLIANKAIKGSKINLIFLVDLQSDVARYINPKKHIGASLFFEISDCESPFKKFFKNPEKKRITEKFGLDIVSGIKVFFFHLDIKVNYE
jgi:hypothetical protein